MKCGESDSRNDDYNDKFSEENFFKLLIPEDSPLIIDIGAHTGESVEFFDSIFHGAKIYSVEPDPLSFLKLQELSSESNIAINVAIGSETGSATFYQYDKSHLNSLYSINKNSTDSLGYAEKCKATEVEVRCITFDDLIEELSITDKRIDLLKIDAQGAEVDVLSGAKKYLSHVDNITLELSFYDFYSKRNTFLEIESLLPDFELYAITKLSQNPKNFRTDWAEVFYTKKK